MLRKHFNLMSTQQLKKAPFYSWQCLTLSLPHRDVDLVIPDEVEMKHLLIFLIHKLHTLDGIKDTALPLQQELKAMTMKEAWFMRCRPPSAKAARDKLRKSQQMMYRQVYLKYLLMKIRCKISYEALVRRQTV